ncbi:hypothetical protein F2Q70_00022265 [Brassica cretica]|uniref:Uncharacterized protein n=1 Tax=Brassica cretica TaxID=69181 RepID=A0A8S9GH95_BRACR|nr:hypothetical protein F2Q70_00022265 [Brassica cretica]
MLESSLLSSILLSLDGMLHLKHLLLHQLHCCSEIILVAGLTHDGVVWPWLLYSGCAARSGTAIKTVLLESHQKYCCKGDFDLILADLKSACFLPTCSEGPERKDPVLGESGGDAASGLDKATGEEGA